MELEKGDKVLIDLKKCQNKDGVTAFRKAKGDVLEVEISNFPSADWLISVESQELGYGQVIDKDYIINGCLQCHSIKIYHDKKKEWFCPFCEN